MNLENNDTSNSKEEALLGILKELEGDHSSEKAYRAIAITKNLINEKSELTKEKELLLNEKEGWEKEKKRLIYENSRLREQLKILRSKQFGKSSEKTKKKIEELEQKIEENEIELELKSNKKPKSEEEKNTNKARRQKFSEDVKREEIILEAPSKCSSCGGEEFRKIGEDSWELLEYIAAQYIVKKYIRPRCACKIVKQCHKQKCQL
ncbi:IS66 family transposase zinc-finger binding domain-containing protein [Candidatus Bandiella numerosa]|uniref:IS66 family transposase zinc-finger binding domain-containing protein n=1 Tax=Candidatus Bandiella numerosa TaxID=2570586 RepID=UPI001F3C378B|nr:IS66 family transposase zinc-finger binding domain-containing protein [Candidatus Bandiella numerosa]